ncbi:hypothetical protein SOVF_150120 [Spinacia oleracea]|nr:hypothetical protein SOVF_150120 [Spinacia oleracea]
MSWIRRLKTQERLKPISTAFDFGNIGSTEEVGSPLAIEKLDGVTLRNKEPYPVRLWYSLNRARNVGLS